MGDRTNIIEEFTREEERRIRRENNQRLTNNMEFTDITEPSPQPSTSGLGRRTMRQLFRENEREESNIAYPYSAFGTRSIDIDDERKPTQEKEESNWWCVPRLLGAMVLIVGLIGGMFALVVIVRSGEEPDKVHGAVIKDPKDFQVCKDVTVSMGERLNINCEFNSSHTYHDSLAKEVTARALAPDATAYLLVNISEPNPTKKEFELEGSHNVSCPWIGLWKISFYGANGAELYTGSFEVNINAPKLTTKLTGGRPNATCGYEGGCKRYDLVFKNVNSGTYINEDKVCDGTSRYREGTNLSCSVTVSSEDNVDCELYDSTVVQTASDPIQTMAITNSPSPL